MVSLEFFIAIILPWGSLSL